MEASTVLRVMMKSDFQSNAREPLAWLRSAEIRRRAARILKRELDHVLRNWIAGTAEDDEVWIWQDYLLLAALAIENLLKGILVCGSPEVVDGGTFRWPGEPHNLRHLVGDLDVLLSEEEVELLDRLTEVIAWGGRYPSPHKEKRLERTSRLGDQERRATTYATTDGEIFEGLFEKLSKRLREERGQDPRWDQALEDAHLPEGSSDSRSCPLGVIGF